MSARNCTKGKSCGATCIDARERCNLELGPLVSKSLGQARDVLQRKIDAGQKVLTEKLRPKDLDWTDEQAAKWLNANQKEILMREIGSLKGGKDTIWTIGNEPGLNIGNYQYNYPELLKAQGGGIEGIRNNPASVVRMLRNELEDNKITSKILGQRLRGGVHLRDADVQEALKQGKLWSGWDVQEGMGRVKAKEVGYQTYLGRAWKLAQELGFKRHGNANISPLPAENEKVWPYGEVFKRAGMDPGVFANRDLWRKTATAERGDLLVQRIREEQPGAVYLGGAPSRGLFDRMSPGNKVYERTVTWRSPQGNEKSATFRAMQIGNTNIVMGPHFTAQMPTAVTDVRKKFLQGDFSGAKTVEAAKVAPKKKGVDPKVADEIMKELRAEVKTKGGGSSGMADWSVLKLQKAYERAYDAGDDLKMRQIVQVLKNKGALVE